MSVKTNDQLMSIYISSLIRAIIAFHDLIDNKIKNRQDQAEEKEKEEKERAEREKKANGESEKEKEGSAEKGESEEPPKETEKGEKE